MAVITKEEYLNALEIVEAYHRQLKKSVEECARKPIPVGKSYAESVELHDISARLYNLLSRRMDDLNELSNMSYKEVKKWRLIGKKTLIELAVLMNKHGLKFKDSPAKNEVNDY